MPPNIERFIKYQMPKQAKMGKNARNSSPEPPIPPGNYICERILDLKIEKGQRHYLIKWLGYDDPMDNTWEPLSNLQNLIQDLLDFEKAHTSRIRKIEDQWRQMYKQGTVNHVLQQLDIARMEEKLERLNESCTPESTPPPKCAKTMTKQKQEKEWKAKPITKKGKQRKNDSTTTCEKRELRSSASEMPISKKEKNEEKIIKRKRGRRPKSKIRQENANHREEDQIIQLSISADKPEDIEAKDIGSLSQALPEPHPQEEHNSEESQHFLTPERNISVAEDGKKTKSQQRSNKQQDNLFQQEDFKEQENKEERNERDQRQQREEQREEQGDYSLRDERLNNEINSYFQDFSNNNSVAAVLSKRLASPPLITSSLPLSQSMPEPVDEIRRESIFKNANGMKLTNIESPRGGCASSLHQGSKKYIIHRKRKAVPQRVEIESQPNNLILKGFQNNPIIELEEQQKESTPVSSVHQRIAQDEQGEDAQVLQEDHAQNLDHSGNAQIAQKEVLEDGISDPKSVELEAKQAEVNIEIEEPNEAQQSIPVLLNQQKQIPQASLDESSNNVLPENDSKEKEREIDGIQAILDKFHKNNSAYIQVDVDADFHIYPTKAANLINIDDENSEKENRAQSNETSYKFSALPKSKRIKKEPRQGLRFQRGIVGKSQQSLVQEGEEGLHYRPSLNTLFQSMLSENEIKLVPGLKIVKLSSCFRLENVIIFAGQIQGSPDTQLQARFISYQTLREYFPRELLAYLEANGMIDL